MMPLMLDILLALVALLVFVVDLLAPRAEKRSTAAVAYIGVALVFVASFFLDVQGEAFGGAFVADALSLYLKRIFLVAGALGLLLSMDHAEKKFPGRQGEFHLLILLSMLGMTVLASSRELMLLIISFELMSIPLYVLAGLNKTKESAESALKLYLVGAASSAITLFGLSLLYGLGGTTMIPELAAKLSTGAQPLASVALMIVLAGLGFKIGAVPFHMWVPDTYQGAPTPFVAFLSVAPKAAGFAALIRIYLDGFLNMGALWVRPVTVICVLTMLLGNLLAIPQSNVKRLLAYSGIGQIGYMMLGFIVVAPGRSEGVGMLLFYLAAYVFTNMGAFAVVTAVGDARNSDELPAYAGLARQHPAIAFAMLIFLLSLAGIPFVAGFWAKINIFLAAYHGGLWALVLMGAVLAVVGVFYYMRIGRKMYMDPPEAGAAAVVMSFSQKAAVVLAFAGVMLMGVLPSLFMNPALEAAKVLLK